MTKNQLAYQANKETQRSNRVQESETKRANVAREAETTRSNTTRERETARSNRANEKLTRRGQNLKAINDLTGSILKLGPIAAAANDPKWYNNYPELVRDTANIAFNGRLGKPQELDFQMPSTSSNRKSESKLIVPGIYTARIIPSLGVGNTADSPINKAARYLYSKIQSQTSYSKDYEQADLMLYIMAVANANALYFHILRAYNYVYKMSPKNDYLGKSLIGAMGFDFTEFKNRLPEIRAKLDFARLELEKFFVPSTLDIVHRYAQLFSFVYKDGSLGYDMDQMYLYVPAGYYKFELDEETSAGKLAFKALSPNTYLQPTDNGSDNSVGAWFDALNGCISAIISNGYQDFMNISGDLEKVFGTTNKITLVPIDNAVGYDLIESEEMGHQFMNLETLSASGMSWNVGSGSPYVFTDSSRFDITQDPSTGNLVFLPFTKLERDVGDVSSTPSAPHILRANVDGITPIDTMVMTRGKMTFVNFAPSVSNDYNSICYLTSCGTEIVVDLFAYYFTGDGTNGVLQTGTFFKNGQESMLKALATFANFKYAPVFTNLNYTMNSATGEATLSTNNQLIGNQLHRWTVLTETQISLMHEAALRSLLYLKE